MTVMLLRLLGGLIGSVVSLVIMVHSVLDVPPEGRAFVYLWIFSEGWLIALGLYVFGLLIGFFGLVPLVRVFGTLVLGKPEYWLDQD